jgi:hypothetical protein
MNSEYNTNTDDPYISPTSTSSNSPVTPGGHLTRPPPDSPTKKKKKFGGFFGLGSGSNTSLDQAAAVETTPAFNTHLPSSYNSRLPASEEDVEFLAGLKPSKSHRIEFKKAKKLEKGSKGLHKAMSQAYMKQFQQAKGSKFSVSFLFPLAFFPSFFLAFLLSFFLELD